MPKIIPGLREQLLAASRVILLREGYAGLTMRSAAKACGISPGTVYNYFTSKDELCATVILEDWMNALQRMRDASSCAATAIDGLRAIHKEISRFEAEYAAVWFTSPVPPGNVNATREHHTQLIAQLTEITEALLVRLCPGFCSEMSAFLAENILGAATTGKDFERLVPVFRLLVQEPENEDKK